MTSKSQSIFILTIILIILALLSVSWPKVKAGFEKKQLILVKVTLKNECSFTSNAFIVVHEKSKRYWHFSNNLARLQILEGDLIRLAMSPKYPDFQYDGDSYPAKTEITLTANCDVDPRMKSIFDSMNKQFK